jgi:hypothetical protein
MIEFSPTAEMKATDAAIRHFMDANAQLREPGVPRAEQGTASPGGGSRGGT